MMIDPASGVVSSTGLVSIPEARSDLNPSFFGGLYLASVALSPIRKGVLGSVEWVDEQADKALHALILNGRVCLVLQRGPEDYLRSDREPLRQRRARMIYDDDHDDGYSLTESEMWPPEITKQVITHYFNTGEISDQITWQSLEDIEPPQEADG